MASTLGAIPAVNLMTIAILLVPRVTYSHYNNLIHSGKCGGAGLRILCDLSNRAIVLWVLMLGSSIARGQSCSKTLPRTTKLRVNWKVLWHILMWWLGGDGVGGGCLFQHHHMEE